MKLIYKGERSGDKMTFPFVEDWENKETKDIKNEEHAKTLLETFPCIHEDVLEDSIIKVPTPSKRIVLQKTEDTDTVTKKKDSKTRDELITECINNGIDPPDRSTKTELKNILNDFSKKEVLD